MKKICLAMTGASGAPYGWRLLECLLKARCSVALLLSHAAEVVLQQEMEIVLPEGIQARKDWIVNHFQCHRDGLALYGRDDWFSPVASGSAPLDAMVICPASGGTLSSIACGASNNLIERAADVCLKERRKLILVPREAPYSQIHLENMLKLTQMGAVIVPASPGFYQRPKGVEDIVDFIVARLLDQLGLEQSLLPKWGD